MELIKPKMSIYDMALKKHILPTRTLRWCCAEFKEMSGAGKVTRIVASVKRNLPGEASVKRFQQTSKVNARKKPLTSGSEHQEKMVTCVGGKDKELLVSPIIHWAETGCMGVSE